MLLLPLKLPIACQDDEPEMDPKVDSHVDFSWHTHWYSHRLTSGWSCRHTPEKCPWLVCAFNCISAWMIDDAATTEFRELAAQKREHLGTVLGRISQASNCTLTEVFPSECACAPYIVKHRITRCRASWPSWTVRRNGFREAPRK